MFAPPIAMAKSAESESSKVAAQRAEPSAVSEAHLLQQSVGKRAMPRPKALRANETRNAPGARGNESDASRAIGREMAPSWSFSKIPLFSPDRGQRPPPLFSAPRLPVQAKHDDSMEREADRVADQVMPMPAARAALISAPTQVSRKCAACEEKEEQLQKKEAGPQGATSEAPTGLHEPRLLIQPKLKIGAVDDPMEQEADRVAEQVMRMADSAPALTSAAPQVSRKCAACEEKEEKLQKKETGPQAAAGEAPASVHDVLRSPGQPLDAAARAYFEPRFGRDFSHVRMHAGAEAAESARALKALAYVVGPHIVWGGVIRAPDSYAGRRLLAHELAHVIQQGAATPSCPLPNAAQERDAEDASRAVAAGETAQVRARSRPGVAAQPEAAQPDVRTVKISDIEAHVRHVMDKPGYGVQDGHAQFNRDPHGAWTMMRHSHFRNDDERLSFALGVLESLMGMDGSVVDRGELYRQLLKYELEMQGQTALVVHTPLTKEESQRLGQLRAASEQREYEAYLAEVKRLKEEADKRTVAHGGVYSGAATTDLYDYYIGTSVREAEREIVEVTPYAVSMMLDFAPVIGQLKAVIEGVVGKDLITGDKLAPWQRGLGILLAIIPEAKGIFTAGRDGIKLLAKGVAAADKSADEAAKIYRIAKGASRLSTEEVQAAEKGVVASKEFRTVAKALDEMEGGATSAERAGARAAGDAEKGAAAAAKPVSGRLARVSEVVTLGGKSHVLSFKRVGRQLRVWLCSNGCGELIAKAEAMLERLPAKSEARGPLQKFINEAGGQIWIDSEPELAEAQDILKELGGKLKDIEVKHPDAVLPDIPVPPAAEPAEAVPAHEHETAPAAPEPPRVDPAALDPPGTQYKRPMVSGKAGATDPPSWVKTDGYKPPRVGEDGEAYANRVLDHKYGPGNWPRGPGTEHNQIQKWADRHFE